MNCSSMATNTKAWTEIEEEDDNMLIKLELPSLKEEFFHYLQNHVSEMHGIVAQLLSLRQNQQISIAPVAEWMHGKFNVNIPVSVNCLRSQRYLLRCPFPHMFGGLNGIDEKIRCEAASMYWISQEFPSIPSPHVWGFGLPDGTTFTAGANLPWSSRAFQHFTSACLNWKPRNVPFLRGRNSFILNSGYLLIDFMEEGTVAAKRWPPNSDDEWRNFYKSFSKIKLQMASRTLEKIGSLTVQNSGEVSLSNRPLTSTLAVLEMEEIPTNMPRSRCYSTTESYLRDLLQCIDMKLIHQPNAVRDEDDAEGQMAVLATLRIVMSSLTQRTLNNGPFIFCWTDMSPDNIFVDDEFNITSIVDLEWCCSLPVETQHPPLWLSGRPLHKLTGVNERAYTDPCEDFLKVFEQEEKDISLRPWSFTNIMRDALRRKTHWLMTILNQPRGAYNLVRQHLQPYFAPTHLKGQEAIQYQEIMARYWIHNATDFIQTKVRQQEDYRTQLRSKYRSKYT